jgi:hypothetical protein
MSATCIFLLAQQKSHFQFGINHEVDRGGRLEDQPEAKLWGYKE